jgi:hypothetical protein
MSDRTLLKAYRVKMKTKMMTEAMPHVVMGDGPSLRAGR